MMENSSQLNVGAMMERLAATMAFCEAPLDGTLVPSAATRYGSSATGGGKVAALLELDAAAKKWPMEKLVATMAFCEAPLDGTGASAPSSEAAKGDRASATAGGHVVALRDEAAKKWPLERLVATMAFCEAPFDGTLDGTSVPSSTSRAAGGSSASATNVPGEDAGGGEDAAALRRAWLTGAKKWPLREHRLLLREKAKAGTVVDGLAIFETVALQ